MSKPLDPFSIGDLEPPVFGPGSKVPPDGLRPGLTPVAALYEYGIEGDAIAPTVRDPDTDVEVIEDVQHYTLPDPAKLLRAYIKRTIFIANKVLNATQLVELTEGRFMAVQSTVQRIGSSGLQFLHSPGLFLGDDFDEEDVSSYPLPERKSAIPEEFEGKTGDLTRTIRDKKGDITDQETDCEPCGPEAMLGYVTHRLGLILAYSFFTRAPLADA